MGLMYAGTDAKQSSGGSIQFQSTFNVLDILAGSMQPAWTRFADGCSKSRVAEISHCRFASPAWAGRRSSAGQDFSLTRPLPLKERH